MFMTTMLNYTPEKMKELQEKINLANKEIIEVLTKYNLEIQGSIIKKEIQPGLFVDTVLVGFNEKKEQPTTEEVTQPVETTTE